MAWGKSKPAAPPSTFSQLLPLIIFFAIVGGLSWVGYQIYLTSNQIQKQASDRMKKKDVVFTKDGLRVGVKHVDDERYVDATQKWVVKAWDHAADSKKPSKRK